MCHQIPNTDDVTRMQLDIDKIRRDGGTQPRSELLIEVMGDYAELMRSGVEFPPITVYFDGKEYWLADGFHRIGARLQVDPTGKIDAEVIQGTLADAQWHSFGVNKAHGLQRTNGDKERAVRAALSHSKSQGLSNYEVARHCGVHERTVRRYRKHIESTTALPQSGDSGCDVSMSENPETPASIDSSDGHRNGSKARPRRGRDGRTINTAKIGGRQRSKAPRPRSVSEVVAARKEGRHATLGSLIKLVLPNNHVHNCAYDLLEHFTFEYLQKVFQEIVNIHETRNPQEVSQ